MHSARRTQSACVWVRVCACSCTSIWSLWSLQSNSFRQKSLKQPRFFGASRYPPPPSSSLLLLLLLSPLLLNSHQPLLLPEITQERHSNPRLAAAQPGRKRGIKTHTKKETHHIVEGGKKSIHTAAPCLEISTDDFGKRATTHTNAPGPRQGKRKSVFVDCVHTFRMKYIVAATEFRSRFPLAQ